MSFDAWVVGLGLSRVLIELGLMASPWAYWRDGGDDLIDVYLCTCFSHGGSWREGRGRQRGLNFGDEAARLDPGNQSYRAESPPRGYDRISRLFTGWCCPPFRLRASNAAAAGDTHRRWQILCCR